MEQSQTSVILIPQEVFVGDIAQLQYTFVANTAIFKTAGDSLSIQAGDKRLTQTEECTLTEATISLNKDGTLTVVLIFTPWEVGTINFPQINFGTTTDPFFVSLPSVTITSLAEKTQTTTLMPPSSPLLIPGTTYILYSLVAGSFLSLVLLIIAFIKIKSFSRLITALFTRILQSRNLRQLRRKMKKLAKTQEKLSSASFANILQHLLRDYLTVRFLHDFKVTTSTEIIALLESKKEVLSLQSFKDNEVTESDNDSIDTFNNIIDETQFILKKLDFTRFSKHKKTDSLSLTAERLKLIDRIEKLALECENVSI